MVPRGRLFVSFWAHVNLVYRIYGSILA